MVGQAKLLARYAQKGECGGLDMAEEADVGVAILFKLRIALKLSEYTEHTVHLMRLY